MRESLPPQRMSMSVLNQSTNDRELRLWLLSASTHQGVTYYRIAGRFSTSGQTWEVSHRYSEFLRLRDQLVKFLSSATDKCPGCRNYLHSIQRFDFPKKHLFASRAPPVVNYRVRALRSFLNLLASWAFSKTPKCPTCGGFAFDVVRNFVLEGDDVSADDMSSIRESVVVEAFAEGLNSSRGPAHMRKNSWMRASPSGNSQPDMVQSMYQPRNRGPQVTELPRPNVTRAQSTEIGSQKIMDRQDRRRPDDDPYDAFNDYLPESGKTKGKKTQSSMEDRVQSGKFSSRPLHESVEDRRRREEEALTQQRLMKPRSEPRNLSAGRALAESDMSVGTSNFESPHSSRRGPLSRGSSTSRHNAESFISDVSMAAEPVLLQGDEYQRYGLSDDERKAKSAASSVYSDDEEIDITGVTLASPPRASKKSSSDNLWQPWELARVA